MCYMEGGEPFEFFSEKTVKARKPHKCSECHRVINPGEKYLRHSSKLDGEFNRGNLCEECDFTRQEFQSDPDHNITLVPGSVEVWLNECIAEGDEDSETKWRPAVEGIRERRRLASVLEPVERIGQ